MRKLENSWKREAERFIWWMDSNEIVNSNGTEFEWMNHSFLLEPLVDVHEQQGMNKSSQIGMSESYICRVTYNALELKWNIGYVLPTSEFVKNFVKEKFNTVVDNNPQVFTRWTPKGSIKLVGEGTNIKIVGEGRDARRIRFVGAHNTQSMVNKENTAVGTSFSADFMAFDERSKHDPFIADQLHSRLDNSSIGIEVSFDNPTTPGAGSDRIWRMSDKQHWLVKCSHCRKYCYLDWVKLDNIKWKPAWHSYIDTKNNEFICGQCGKPLSDYDRRNGVWRALYPSIKDYRGYWFSQLMYTQHDVASLLKAEKRYEATPGNFHNMALGKPYIGSDVKILRKNVTDNINGDVNSLQNNVMGVDQGARKWYVIGNEQGIVEAGYCNTWEEIEFLFNKYNCKCMVIDNGPTPTIPEELSHKYPGRVWRAVYRTESDRAMLVEFSDMSKSEDYMVYIRREDAIDYIARQIVEKRYPLNTTVNKLEYFIIHWCNLYRKVETDNFGNERFKWVELGDDHLAHATVYFEAAKSHVAMQDVGLSTTIDTGERSDVVQAVEVVGGQLKINGISSLEDHIKSEDDE